MEPVDWTAKWGAGIVAVVAVIIWLVSIWGAAQLNSAGYPLAYWLGYWTVVQSCATWTFARAYPLIRGRTEYTVRMFKGPTLGLLVVSAILFLAGPSLAAAVPSYWQAGLGIMLVAVVIWFAAVWLWYSSSRRVRLGDSKLA